ncbi:zinc-binding alcohol dehydrogenase [Variovorax soli]|uniref:Threonine dehydrogenase-like Zn-dependent dehydrogenase n=1 Tax=Variovorax soli TaxID=376815 RepID=A0ABU1NHY5_9BURK|nr:zinc-binding alcohol dehydrogenase [Variovorax soli]MDR6538068.1 threonine dehydrogenase-like Zn-dependent dehydrogenase [Variovorax soli]
MPANPSRVAPGESRACWVEAPGRAGLRQAVLPVPGNGEVRVRALHSGISRGTELLVFRGEVPESEHERMRAPFQEGDFPAPLKYGYANVGVVEEGPRALLGRTVFCLYPHQTHYVVPAGAVHPLPEGLPPARAVLAANMETAVNALWDAAPRIGDRIAVVGAGVVGLLAAWLAGRLPGCEVEVIDTNPGRRAIAEGLGLAFASPQAARADADLVIHASGNGEGLATALRLAAFEATVLEMSWYGSRAVTLPLGEAFHARRLTLRSSQVGHVSPSQRARWSHGRRLALALALLRDPALDALLTDAAPFDTLPAVLARLAAGAPQTLCHRIDYP